jgi:hypothetical protein
MLTAVNNYHNQIVKHQACEEVIDYVLSNHEDKCSWTDSITNINARWAHLHQLKTSFHSQCKGNFDLVPAKAMKSSQEYFERLLDAEMINLKAEKDFGSTLCIHGLALGILLVGMFAISGVLAPEGLMTWPSALVLTALAAITPLYKFNNLIETKAHHQMQSFCAENHFRINGDQQNQPRFIDGQQLQANIKYSLTCADRKRKSEETLFSIIKDDIPLLSNLPKELVNIIYNYTHALASISPPQTIYKLPHKS